MTQVGLLLGGVIGAAQLTVMWGIASSLIGGSHSQSRIVDAAGWLLLVVPVGALAGVTLSAVITRFRVSEEGWAAFFGLWGAATVLGFPAALMAPALLVGLGPDYQPYRFLAFVVEYGLAWLLMFFLFRPRHRAP